MRCTLAVNIRRGPQRGEGPQADKHHKVRFEELLPYLLTTFERSPSQVPANHILEIPAIQGVFFCQQDRKGTVKLC